MITAWSGRSTIAPGPNVVTIWLWRIWPCGLHVAAALLRGGSRRVLVRRRDLDIGRRRAASEPEVDRRLHVPQRSRRLELRASLSERRRVRGRAASAAAPGLRALVTADRRRRAATSCCALADLRPRIEQVLGSRPQVRVDARSPPRRVSVAVCTRTLRQHVGDDRPAPRVRTTMSMAPRGGGRARPASDARARRRAPAARGRARAARTA